MDYEISEMAAQLEAEINPDAMSEDELQGIVGKELEDAIDYADNYVSRYAPPRQNITEAIRSATRKRVAAKLLAWTCATQCKLSCRR